MKQIHKHVTALFLVFAMAFMLSIPAWAIDGAFSDNAETTKEGLLEEYGWDEDKLYAKQWEDVVDDTKYIYQRESGFQAEYMEDMTTTTKLYLGIKDEASGYATGAGIVKVAIDEYESGEGYETPMGSNRVKYNDWYYGRPAYGEDYPWCAVFVSWCAEQCGLLESGTFPRTAGCANMVGYFQSKGFDFYPNLSLTPFGGGSYTPVPGDIIFWSGWSHVGIIVEVTDNTIVTIEGNSADMVRRNVYTRGNLGSLNFGVTFHIEYPSAEATIFNFLRSEMGYNAAAASGVLANIQHESNFNPQALGDNGTSYGICQWHLDRYDALISFCNANGYDYTTIEGQLWYLKSELESGYSNVHSQLLAVPNTAQGCWQAAYAWCYYFERPAGYNTGTSDMRGDTAKYSFWPIWGGM